MSDSFPCLKQGWIISTTYFSRVEDFFFSPHGSDPSQIHSWTWRTLTSNRKMLHTKGNLVTPWLWEEHGCRGRAELKADRGDFCDYSSVVILFPKGEWAVTTWRLYKRFDAFSPPTPHTHTKCNSPSFKMGWKLKHTITIHAVLNAKKNKKQKQEFVKQKEGNK